MAYINIRVSNSLKEELAWAIDKRIRLISNIMLFKIRSYTTKKLKNKALKEYCMRCYVALSRVHIRKIDLGELTCQYPSNIKPSAK